MKKSALFLFFLISFCYSSNGFAQDARQDFVLVNKTGFEIHQVYIAPSKETDWGTDILGKDVMAIDEEWDIKFHPKDNVCKWDLRIEDKDGNFVIWEDIDLCKWAKITLHYDGKVATVTFE
jgi:hypothetical protein